MLCIEYDGLHKNRITLTRGDSATLKLKLYDAQNKPVVLTEADRAVLTVKQDIDSPAAVLQLEAKENSLIYSGRYSRPCLRPILLRCASDVVRYGRVYGNPALRFYPG